MKSDLLPPDSEFLDEHEIRVLRISEPGWEQVTLYLMTASPSVPVASMYRDALSDDEILRSERFVRISDQRRFLHCRAKVRMLLAHHLRCSAQEVSLRTDAFEKPRLTSGDLAINWSNSGEWALLGVGSCRAIGVDVERIRVFSEMDGIASSHFADAEHHHYQKVAAVGASQPREFFRIWTLKEAYIKAVGRGLSIPLTSFSVVDERGFLCAPAAEVRAWMDTSVDGYSVAAIIL